jgi:hypothetical protein
MTSDSVPTVGQLLVAAFGFSRAKNSQLNQRWIGMSWRIGSQLPQSLLSISIQRLGEVDLVCRALETELMTQPQQAGDLDLRPNYLAVLSEWWIGSAYAICYTLKDRKIMSDAEFLRLANELRMIRVQVEKYEVPSDRGLIEPLQFSPTQLRPDEKEAPIYTYDKNDRLKSHIPRTGVSHRYSYMWEVFDVKADATRWYERLDLSDRMLNLLAPVAEVAADTAAASSSAVPE